MDIGYSLFVDRKKLKPTFIVGDAYDAQVDWEAVNAKIDIINASAFFHLFPWPKQVESLLSLGKVWPAAARDGDYRSTDGQSHACGIPESYRRYHGLQTRSRNACKSYGTKSSRGRDRHGLENPWHLRHGRHHGEQAVHRKTQKASRPGRSPISDECFSRSPDNRLTLR